MTLEATTTATPVTLDEKTSFEKLTARFSNGLRRFATFVENKGAKLQSCVSPEAIEEGLTKLDRGLLGIFGGESDDMRRERLMEERLVIGRKVYAEIAKNYPFGETVPKTAATEEGGVYKVGISDCLKNGLAISYEKKGGGGAKEWFSINVDTEGHLVFFERDTDGLHSHRSRRNNPSEIADLALSTLTHFAQPVLEKAA